MNLPVAFDAPGKLMLAGEYAVLYGAKALATATSARLSARVEAIDGDFDELVAPGLLDEVRSFSRQPEGELRWRESRHEELALFETLLLPYVPALTARYGSALRFSIDSRAFTRGARKLGLGSSAAVAVALNAALAAAVEQEQSALSAHTAFQEGEGSGTDIAIARYGGTQCVVRECNELRTTALDWPAGLHYCVVDTGHSQSTKKMLQALRAFEVECSNSSTLIDNLCERANESATAWQVSADDFVASLAGFRQGLQALDTASGLGLYSHGHDSLDELGVRLGVAYKPSGAGGGDIGIAFSTDTAKLAEFRRQASALRFSEVKVQLACAGLTEL
ncbi:MAG: hypothetical protein AAF385_15935 [Pseudomonadota bacterium]